MIGEIRQNFTEASASVGLILATALDSVTPNLGWLMFKEFTPPRYNSIHFRGFLLPLAPSAQKLEF